MNLAFFLKIWRSAGWRSDAFLPSHFSIVTLLHRCLPAAVPHPKIRSISMRAMLRVRCCMFWLGYRSLSQARSDSTHHTTYIRGGGRGSVRLKTDWVYLSSPRTCEPVQEFWIRYERAHLQPYIFLILQTHYARFKANVREQCVWSPGRRFPPRPAVEESLSRMYTPCKKAWGFNFSPLKSFTNQLKSRIID